MFNEAFIESLLGLLVLSILSLQPVTSRLLLTLLPHLWVISTYSR